MAARCPVCGEEFETEEALVAHEALKHTARGRRKRDEGSRIHPTRPRDRRPPPHWPQG